MASKLSSLLQPCSLAHLSLVTGRVSWLIRKKNKSWMLPRSPLLRTLTSCDPRTPSEGFYTLNQLKRSDWFFGRIDWFLALNLKQNHLKKGWGTSRNANGWLVGKRHGGKQQTNKPPAKIDLPKNPWHVQRIDKLICLFLSVINNRG